MKSFNLESLEIGPTLDDNCQLQADNISVEIDNSNMAKLTIGTFSCEACIYRYGLSEVSDVVIEAIHSDPELKLPGLIEETRGLIADEISQCPKQEPASKSKPRPTE